MKNIYNYLESCENLILSFSNLNNHYKEHPEHKKNLFLVGGLAKELLPHYKMWTNSSKKIKAELKELYLNNDVVKIERIQNELRKIEERVNNTILLKDDLDEHNNIKCKRFCKETKELVEWFNEIKGSLIISKSSLNASDLPEIDLTTQKEQIRLIYDLGIIDFLQNKYPKTLNNNNSQVAHLVSKILKLKYISVQPSINELLSDKVGKNYPKETSKTKAIIDKLNANESK